MNALPLVVTSLALACTLTAQKTPPDAQGSAAKPASEGKSAQDKQGKDETPKVNPIDQLKQSLELAKKEAAHLRQVKQGGGVLGRFLRNRKTAQELAATFTPATQGPAPAPKKFVARLLGDGERAALGDDVLFTVQKMPVTNKEFEDTMEFLKGYPREDATQDVKTAAIHMIVRAKAWQGLYPADARKAYEAALEIKSALDKGGSFSDLAKQHSDDKATAANGGKRDYIVKQTADRNYARAAFGLKVGEVSGVIATAEGFHIVRLLAKKAGDTPDKDRALTSHILKTFADSADKKAMFHEALAKGRVDIAFRTDDLRKFAPASYASAGK